VVDGSFYCEVYVSFHSRSPRSLAYPLFRFLDAAVAFDPGEGGFPVSPSHPCCDGFEDFSVMCVHPVAFFPFPSVLCEAIYRVLESLIIFRSSLGGWFFIAIRIAISSPVWLDCSSIGTLMLMFRGSPSPYHIPRPAEAFSSPLLMHVSIFTPDHRYLEEFALRP
jgi:hypothetical protein